MASVYHLLSHWVAWEIQSTKLDKVSKFPTDTNLLDLGMKIEILENS